METIADHPSSMYSKEADMRRGADWFFWVAALGVINTLLVTLSGLANTVFGLGATRAVDEYLRAGTLAPVSIAGLPINLAIAGLFAFLGYYARKGHDKIFVLGIFLYAVDAMITVGFRDFFGFGFHLVALFFLTKGLLASRKRFDPSV